MTVRGAVHPVQLSSANTLGGIRQQLGARYVEALVLTPRIEMWRDLEAVMRDRPVMNVAAMATVIWLSGPVATRVIFGNVLLLRRGQAGLTPGDFHLLRKGLEEAIADHRIGTDALDPDDRSCRPPGMRADNGPSPAAATG